MIPKRKPTGPRATFLLRYLIVGLVFANVLIIWKYGISTNSNKLDGIMASRKLLLEEQCKLLESDHSMPYTNGVPALTGFIWNREWNIGWCPVLKAGELNDERKWGTVTFDIGYSSWLYNMLLLKGFTAEVLDRSIVSLHSLSLNESVYGGHLPEAKTLSNSTKILIVRHPFERLLSAYKERVSPEGNDDRSKQFAEMYDKSFRNAVRNFTNDLADGSHMSWEQFVDVVVSTASNPEQMNRHWRPVYHTCTPCAVKYDIIAQIETFLRDQRYMINRLGLNKLTSVKPRWGNSRYPVIKSNTLGGTDNDSLLKIGEAKYYFQKLSKKQIIALYQAYLPDFRLFGYAYNDYLQLGW